MLSLFFLLKRLLFSLWVSVVTGPGVGGCHLPVPEAPFPQLEPVSAQLLIGFMSLFLMWEVVPNVPVAVTPASLVSL